MAKDPAFLFYTSDFLSGTYTMSDEQVGRYIRLLCLQHQKGFLTLKDIDFVCKGRDQEIFDKFQEDENGNYFNKVLSEKIELRKKHSDRQKENIQKRYQTSTEPLPNDENLSTKRLPLEIVNEIEIETVIEILNETTGRDFKKNTESNKRWVRSRFKEGYTIEDFKKVISSKQFEWGKNPDMAKFLRPETLFGNKFEGYLQSAKNKINGTTAKNIGSNEFQPGGPGTL